MSHVVLANIAVRTNKSNHVLYPPQFVAELVLITMYFVNGIS
jgi:hypothetical protein